jgi:hypothetical protein
MEVGVGCDGAYRTGPSDNRAVFFRSILSMAGRFYLEKKRVAAGKNSRTTVSRKSSENLCFLSGHLPPQILR